MNGHFDFNFYLLKNHFLIWFKGQIVQFFLEKLHFNIIKDTHCTMYRSVLQNLKFL